MIGFEPPLNSARGRMMEFRSQSSCQHVVSTRNVDSSCSTETVNAEEVYPLYSADLTNRVAYHFGSKFLSVTVITRLRLPWFSSGVIANAFHMSLFMKMLSMIGLGNGNHLVKDEWANGT
ncbi:unnamed protein product [Acanthocheilonema viteae]|uniref:Uncharacterized protein n=1 Tax=Acanthocheilonema viteae TaxID=6277 RepID=A0A498SBZ9_ACAVI|nr:unnamed protein product [Acanthocheilonema viteae]